jgi:hypothetical protein
MARTNPISVWALWLGTWSVGLLGCGVRVDVPSATLECGPGGECPDGLTCGMVLGGEMRCCRGSCEADAGRLDTNRPDPPREGAGADGPPLEAAPALDGSTTEDRAIASPPADTGGAGIEGRCSQDSECPTMARPFCSANACVECRGHRDCQDEANPICLQNRCTPCTRDAQCGERDDDQPGICLWPGEGRCARDEETIYVKNANPCSQAGGGASTMPFCQPQMALAALRATRRIIRIRGPQPTIGMVISRAGEPITIIGQAGATIRDPISIGAQVIAGNVRIRGLAFVGSQTGIVVSGGTIQLNRVVVEANREGGLQISSGVTFDISNSVFAKNGRGLVGPVRFGGVLLGTPGAGRTGRFWASTVVDNLDVGVVCSSSNQTLEGVLLFNNSNGDSFGCMAATGRLGLEPRFSSGRPNRLTEGAPCQDAMVSEEMPLDDIDGEPRPYPDGGRADCGADEFHPQPSSAAGGR